MPNISDPILAQPGVLPAARLDRTDELADRTRRRFADAAQANDDERRRLLAEVVTSHLWLAESLARRFRYRGEDEQDLVQVARTGLVEATQRFDADRGSFVAFAVPTILGVLRRHFRDHGWGIRPPRETQELVSGIRREWPFLVQTLQSIPTEADLAASLGATVTAVRGARYAGQGYSWSSLDAAPEAAVEGLAGGEETGRLEARLVVAQVSKLLTPAERHLLWLRFYEQLSQAEIAGLLGISQMQVSRRLARLLAKLRQLVGEDDLTMAS